MPRIRAVISVDDSGRGIGASGKSPLRCAYVRHEPVGPTYITDINGIIRDENGNEGIDSLTSWADVTIHCQNSVARVLDGADPLQRCPTVPTFRINRPKNGSRATATITPAVPNINIAHWRLLNQAFDAYHLVWRQFEPFFSLGEFPLGRSNLNLEITRNQKKRIELIFPGPVQALATLAGSLGLPPPGGRILSYTDPVGTFDGWPRILVEPDPPEMRLFTGSGNFGNGNLRDLTLVPAEMAHALHFSLLTKLQRDAIRRDYLGFLINQFVNGLGTGHSIGIQTSPMVAFIESLDHFSHRLSESVRSRLRTYPTNPQTVNRYLSDEFLGRNPVFPRIARFTTDRLGTNDPRNRVEGRPASNLAPLSGSLDEGAIFGGLFLSLSWRVGLKEVVEAVLASKKTTFGEFRKWFNIHRTALKPEMDDMVEAWGL